MAECKDGAPGSASERNSRYLLIVDSDADELYYIAMLLQRFEYNICTARNADEAIEMVSVALPTLIVSDLSLTGRNVFELLQQLKRNPRAAQVPVVIKALDPSPDVERKCLQAGAVLIRRPVQAEDLYRIVQSRIENTPRENIRIYTRLPVMANNKPLDCGGEGECATVLSQHGMYVRTLEAFSADRRQRPDHFARGPGPLLPPFRRGAVQRARHGAQVHQHRTQRPGFYPAVHTGRGHEGHQAGLTSGA